MRLVKTASCLALALFLASWGADAQTLSPRGVYQQFSNDVFTKDFKSAYSLLDDHAKVEVSSTFKALLQINNVPLERINQYSDYELFARIMNHQNATSIDILNEIISGSSAYVNTIAHSDNGDQKNVISLIMIDGRWFIHSVGFHVSNAQTDSREALVSEAWQHLNDKDYPAAIKSSSDCITKFHRQAEGDQSAAMTHKEPVPGKGKMNINSFEAQHIFERGVLNDVSACYFVLATSQASSDNCRVAKQAYEALKKLTYARIWDPKGWFWDPSESADDWLTDYGDKC